MFNGCNPLNMKELGNRVFQFRLIFGQDGQYISVLGKEQREQLERRHRELTGTHVAQSIHPTGRFDVQRLADRRPSRRRPVKSDSGRSAERRANARRDAGVPRTDRRTGYSPTQNVIESQSHSSTL